MPDAEIISIGTELILGDISDTNSSFIAQRLKNIGIDLKRITIISDDRIQIKEAFQDSIKRSNIIISTGGLGPTVDDPTRDAVADAINVYLEFQPFLWEQIVNKFGQYGHEPTENNKKQAYIPKGATPVKNPIGTAPAFTIQTRDNLIICLPGVPEEMKYLFEQAMIPCINNWVNEENIILTKILHTASIGESTIDEYITTFEKSINPTVGLLAKPGQTDIRITARAKSREEATSLLNRMSENIYAVLGQNIYGEDDTTLESIVEQQLIAKSIHIKILHNNLDQVLSNQTLALNNLLYVETENIGIDKNHANQFGEITIYVNFSKDVDRYILTFTTNINNEELSDIKYYAGPEELSKKWVNNVFLDFIRRLALNFQQ